MGQCNGYVHVTGNGLFRLLSVSCMSTRIEKSNYQARNRKSMFEYGPCMTEREQNANCISYITYFLPRKRIQQTHSLSKVKGNRRFYHFHANSALTKDGNMHSALYNIDTTYIDGFGFMLGIIGARLTT